MDEITGRLTQQPKKAHIVWEKPHSAGWAYIGEHFILNGLSLLKGVKEDVRLKRIEPYCVTCNRLMAYVDVVWDGSILMKIDAPCNFEDVTCAIEGHCCILRTGIYSPSSFLTMPGGGPPIPPTELQIIYVVFNAVNYTHPVPRQPQPVEARWTSPFLICEELQFEVDCLLAARRRSARSKRSLSDYGKGALS